MISLLSDENFDNHIVRGVLRRDPQIDLIRMQDHGLAGIEDPDLLEWAAKSDRVLLTHDANTIPAFAYQRVDSGLSMPGVFIVGKSVPIGIVIADIVLIARTSLDGEWEGQVRHLPLR